MSPPTTTAAKLHTFANERSSSLVMNAIPKPRPRIARKLTCFSTLSRLVGFRKFGAAAAKIRNRIPAEIAVP
jgi:hypothetical protein